MVKLYDSTAEDEILPVLQRRTSFEFKEKSLHQVLQAIEKQHDVGIHVHRSVKEELDIDPARQMVTIDVTDVPLRAALNRFLTPLGLSCVIEHDVLLITSRHFSEARLATRAYPARDVLASDSKGSDFEALIEVITHTIKPESWTEQGGPGSIEPFEIGDVIVCDQTPDVHEKIEALLRRFRSLMPELKLKGVEDDTTVSWRAYHLVSTTRPEADLADAVAQLVREFIAPETWTAKDTQAVIRALPDRIVVRQTLRVHRETAKLLNELELYSSDIPGRGPPMPP